MITVFEPLTRPRDTGPKSSAVLTNPATNTFDFVMERKTRDVSDKITPDDVRELAKTGLKDESYFIRAKAVYAAGGGTKEIWIKCGNSVSYAEKVHAAFQRACK